LNAEERPSSFYIQSVSNTVKIVNDNLPKESVVGKTYKLSDNETDVLTESNSTINIAYPNNVFVKLYEKSKFLMHNCTIEFDSIKMPSVLNSIHNNYTFSLMNGIMDVLNNNTNVYDVCAIHTPRINLLLNRGMFRVIVQDKMTIVVVNKGSLYALNLIEDRKREIKENNIGIITTYIPIDGNAYYLDKASLTMNLMSDDDVQKMNGAYQNLTNFNNGVIFIIMDNEIVGVKAK